MSYSAVEADAFGHNRFADDEDTTAQCPLALNGKGPYPGHCIACVRALRPPRPYPLRDVNGRIIVSDCVDLLDAS